MIAILLWLAFLFSLHSPTPPLPGLEYGSLQAGISDSHLHLVTCTPRIRYQCDVSSDAHTHYITSSGPGIGRADNSPQAAAVSHARLAARIRGGTGACNCASSSSRAAQWFPRRMDGQRTLRTSDLGSRTRSAPRAP